MQVKYLLTIFMLVALLIPLQGSGQLFKVVDSLTRDELPFVTVKLGAGGKGLISDIHGVFRINGDEGQSVEVSYLGYRTTKVTLRKTTDTMILRLSPTTASMSEVVFTPPYDKIRRIINLTIAHRDNNNPDRYNEYRCKVYYKMTADIRMPDSSSLSMDTTEDTKQTMDFLSRQHLLMSETYSIRTWKKPQKLQEEVLASRFSGFKKSLFTTLVTDVLPFHSYTDYLSLNGKDYHNPVSRGYALRYDFNLNDEILDGNDTTWVLSFRPRHKSQDHLSGIVFITSNGFAITHFIARGYDEKLKRLVKIEQHYSHEQGRWFPKELNYVIDWQQKIAADTAGKPPIHYNLIMKGSSRIDSVAFNIPQDFRFDKAHAVKLRTKADELDNTTWNSLRPVALDKKERRTYQYTDSIMDELNVNRFVPYLDKIIEGKFPVSIFDLDLKRIYSNNKYEGSRLGLGVQTNEKLLRRVSFGGWYGYGFRDKQSKYGGFIEGYLDEYKDFTVKLAYDNDLRDPGRVQIDRELDKNYLRMFLMKQVDAVTSYSFSLKKRIGYWQTSFIARHESVAPQYPYYLSSEPGAVRNFETNELSIGLRYAFAERRAPMFGKYFKTSSKFPIAYARLTYGQLQADGFETDYMQVLGAVAWTKHINRIGNERILAVAGKSWSEKALPLSKLFAGNGFRYDESSIYAFGGMLTLYPYEYYMDEFVSLYWKHDFDWRIYKTGHSAPFISLAHNMLYGSLENRSEHNLFSFSVPENGYHETGIILNSLLRVSYLDLCYFTLNAGYFYHWTNDINLDKNGRFVYGIGLEF